ncbi:MAG: hypothetical protein ACE5O2_15430 [Armatimonadota bacterium]
MTTRSFLAIVLCPVLGIVSGSWIGAVLLPWGLARAGYSSPTGTMDLLPYVLFAAAAGLLVGLAWAPILIWLFARGSASPQRALADLVTIGLGTVAFADGVCGLAWRVGAGSLRLSSLIEAAWPKLWATTCVVWLLGLSLSLVAFRRARKARP